MPWPHGSVKHAKNRLRHEIILRMKMPRTRKIFATALACFAAAAIVWGMNPLVISAANPGLTIAKFTGSKLAEAGIAIGIAYVALDLLQRILSFTLGIVGGFLDFAFNLNTAINPGQLAVVQSGWTILRDLANGVFILLVLWIAITIIFNLESLGGKKFLVRIILVALLINFSLAMVSTVFAFGNELAKPFQKALRVVPKCDATKCDQPETTLSQLIINNSQIHEATRIIVDEGAVERAKRELEAASKKPPPTETEPSVFGFLEYLGAPQTAHAFAPFVPILVYLGWAAAGAIASALLSSLALVGAHLLGIDEVVFRSIFNLVIADTFLFLAISAMLTATVVLLLRLVAMVFLGVFAPIAFLGLAFPKYGNKAWDPWIDNLFRWTFVAPIFYFLLYLSLLMLQTNRSGGEAVFKEIPFTANFFKILNLVLFLVFLWASVYLTKKTAGHAAEVALGLGRKLTGFALGVGTGLAARGAGALALRGAKPLEKTFETLGRAGIGIPLARRTQRYLAAQRKRVEEREAHYTGGSEDFYRSQLDSATSAETITALASAAMKAGKGRALVGREERVVNAAKRIGLQEQFLKLAPHLTKQADVSGSASDPDAIERLLRGMNIDDKLKVSDNSLANQDVLNALWKTVNAQGLGRIGLENKAMHDAMFTHLNAMDPVRLQAFRDSLTPARDQEFAQYFTGGLYNSTGRRWEPQHWGATRPGTGGAPPPTAFAVPPTHSESVASGGSPSRSLSASGGSGTYTWRIRSGSPPPGITLNPTGGFTGIAAGVRGTTYTFDAEVDDGAGNTGVMRVTMTVT